ncbi:MAG: hypothetical protein QXD43_04460 [Candidatus Aenigmatarchaeota archaeon]
MSELFLNFSKFLSFKDNETLKSYDLLKKNLNTVTFNISQYKAIIPEKHDEILSFKHENSLVNNFYLDTFTSDLTEIDKYIFSFEKKYDKIYHPNKLTIYQPGDIYVGKYARLHLTENAYLTSNNYRASLILDNKEAYAILKGYNFKILSEDASIKIYTQSSSEEVFGDILNIESNKNGTNVSKIVLDQNGFLNFNISLKEDKYANRLLIDNKKFLFLLNEDNFFNIDINSGKSTLFLSKNEFTINFEKILFSLKTDSETFDLNCKNININGNVNYKGNFTGNGEISLKNFNIVLEEGGMATLQGVCPDGAVTVYVNTIRLKINNKLYRIPVIF